MREVKAPLEPIESRELIMADDKAKKIGKFIVTSTLIVGAALIAKKLITAIGNRKNKFKVYKVVKT